MRWMVVAGVAAAVGLMTGSMAQAAEPGWGHYGGDAGGQRFSAAAQVTPGNVRRLHEVWRTAIDSAAVKGKAMGAANFENTSILADGRLYTCSPFNQVSALDPATGRQLWRYDPHLDTTIRYPNKYVCRGVAFARVAASGACAARIWSSQRSIPACSST